MQRMNRMVLSLIAVLVLGSSLALLGCGDDDDDNTTNLNAGTAQSTVGGRVFTFNQQTAFGTATGTLAFNSTANRFAFSSSTFRATGAVTYGSCIFLVGSGSNPDAAGGGSNFPPTSGGPQPNQQIIADPCTFNNDTGSLTLGSATSTSSTVLTGTGGFGG